MQEGEPGRARCGGADGALKRSGRQLSLATPYGPGMSRLGNIRRRCWAFTRSGWAAALAQIGNVSNDIGRSVPPAGENVDESLEQHGTQSDPTLTSYAMDEGTGGEASQHRCLCTVRMSRQKHRRKGATAPGQTNRSRRSRHSLWQVRR
eukprot:764793-Hanusia_phi.AAC.3